VNFVSSWQTVASSQHERVSKKLEITAGLTAFAKATASPPKL